VQLRPSEERQPADAPAMRTDGAFGLGARDLMRWIMSVSYMIGGVAHLALAANFCKLCQIGCLFVEWWSDCEIAGSVALASTPLRRLAGKSLRSTRSASFPQTSNT
jgi:hypothetical protein